MSVTITMTAGSLVRILASSGTSFCVKLDCRPVSEKFYARIKVSYLIQGFDHAQEREQSGYFYSEDTRFGKDKLTKKNMRRYPHRRTQIALTATRGNSTPCTSA